MKQNKLRTVLALLLALATVIAFAACGKKEKNDDKKAADKTPATGLVLQDEVKPYIEGDFASALDRFMDSANTKLIDTISKAIEERHNNSENPEEWIKAAISIDEAFNESVKPKIEALREANKDNKDNGWLILSAHLSITTTKALDIELASLDYKNGGTVSEADAEDAINAAVELLEALGENLYTEESAKAFLAKLEDLL